MTNCGVLGIKMPTRSPFFMPRGRKSGSKPVGQLVHFSIRDSGSLENGAGSVGEFTGCFFQVVEEGYFRNFECCRNSLVVIL
jgi:hypothetical protein